MLDVLTRRKRLLEAESAAAHHRLLYEFLAQLLRHRTHQLDQLAREAALVKKVSLVIYNFLLVSV